MDKLKANWRPGQKYTADAANAVAKRVNDLEDALDGVGPGTGATKLADLDTTVTGPELNDLAAKVDGVAEGADVTNAASVAAAVDSSTAKPSPAASDTIGIVDSEGTRILKKITWAELLDAVPPGFDLHPSEFITEDYTAAAGDLVRVTATDSVTVTLPNDPAGDDMVGVLLLGDGEVTLAAGGGAEIGQNGSGLTEIPLSASQILVVLSIWRYDAATDHWFPITENAAPASTDIVDSTPVGRALLTVEDVNEARELLGAVSEGTISALFSSSWIPPVPDAVSATVEMSFSDATSGVLPTLVLTGAYADGLCAVVAVMGYRNDSETITLAVTCGGIDMEPVGGPSMGNAVALNASNASFLQFFVLLGAPAGEQDVVVSWTATGTTDPHMSAVAATYTGVQSFTAQVSHGGTESGTALEQVVISAPGRLVIQAFVHEPLSGSAITGYNQTQRAALNGGSNAQAVVGDALGASTVTFAATRTSGADYSATAFQLVGTLEAESAVLMLDDTTEFGRALVDAADAAAARTLLEVSGDLSDYATESYVNSGLAGKVDVTSSPVRIYGTNGSGEQTTYAIGAAESPNTIAYRNSSGVLRVGTPTDPADATPKTYVDTQVGTRATSAQGALADSAVQPGDLSSVATSGVYGDLTGRPTLGTAAAANTSAFATAAQGALADSAVQPGALAEVATSGAYADLSGKPSIPPAVDALTDLDTTVTGAQLNALKAKVDGIDAGAEVNVNPDWNASSGDAQILNKPTLAAVATSGSKVDVGLGNVDNTSDAAKWAAAKTLTNTRITARIGSTASAATITANANNHDAYHVTALATGATIAAPTGTPTDGQPLRFRFKDNGTGHALAWNAIFRAIGITLPTSTTASKTLYVQCAYNAADAKWDVLAVGEAA